MKKNFEGKKMTEYWVSNPKKFCEICKCWIYNNKISISNHEKGTRHVGNMHTKIAEMGRKGKERARDEAEKSQILKEMEMGALRSFQKDLESDPQLQNQYFGEGESKIPGFKAGKKEKFHFQNQNQIRITEYPVINVSQ